MRLVLIFICIAQICTLHAKPKAIHVQDRKEYEILDLFFKMGILEEEYGYVLEGVKPISARQFYPLGVLLTKDLQHSENELKKTLLVREAIPVWNKLCSHQERFVLKAIPIVENDADAYGYEVQFIHIPKLREVIQENIHLFRYILGPNVEVEELINRLAYSTERFTDVLQDNITLIGIVLGFGSHNSIVGGRLETLDRLSISKDNAPFLPKSTLLQGEDNWARYGISYLEYAGGDDTAFRQVASSVRPSFGFNTIQDEILSLQSKMEPLPKTLQDQPRFIFGAFRGAESNQSLFQALRKAQKHSHSLYQSHHRLEKVLEIIGGKKPHITCEKSPVQKDVWALIDDLEKVWSCILKGAALHFTNAHDRQIFKQTLTMDSVSTTPPMIGASREMLRGLVQARENFIKAQSQCIALAKDSAIQTVIPDQLFVKIGQQGTGKKVEGVNRLRLKYVIEEFSGNVLFADNDIWLNVSETIQGFLYGLQGMRIGEKRTLFIHPALGYGPLTTLPPCALLVAHVQLLDADFATQFSMPPLKPLEFNWLQNEQLYCVIEESIKLLPTYMGAFYRNLLKKIELAYPSFGS